MNLLLIDCPTEVRTRPRRRSACRVRSARSTRARAPRTLWLFAPPPAPPTEEPHLCEIEAERWDGLS
jgi:hypothetical protein